MDDRGSRRADGLAPDIMLPSKLLKSGSGLAPDIELSCIILEAEEQTRMKGLEHAFFEPFF